MVPDAIVDAPMATASAEESVVVAAGCFWGVQAVFQHVKSGRLRPLGVTSARPSALVPGIPSVAEAGVPGYEVASADSVFVPARTPAPIITWLNREIVRIIHLPDVHDQFEKLDYVVVGSSAQQFAERVRRDTEKYRRVILESRMQQLD